MQSVIELLDHIDALQAENERLRAQVADINRLLEDDRAAYRARVTLLEGLLLWRHTQSKRLACSADCPSWAHNDCTCLYGEKQREIDAALSRSDADSAPGT